MKYIKPKCKKCKQDLKFCYIMKLDWWAVYLCENCMITYTFDLTKEEYADFTENTK